MIHKDADFVNSSLTETKLDPRLKIPFLFNLIYYSGIKGKMIC